MQYTPTRNPLAHASTAANAAARLALTTVSPVKQADTGHLHCFLGGDVASELNWMDLGHYNTAPSNTAVPTISGSAQVGVQLAAVAGAYGGYPAPSHASWQWQVSNDGATGWSDISGATSSTYTPVAADEGKYLRAKEGQSNVVGTVYACSAATGVVGVSHWRLKTGTAWGAMSGNSGANYQVNDIVSLGISNVTVTTQAQARLVSVDENGGVTGVDLYEGGDYGANPGFTQAETTGGSGTGLWIETTYDTCFEQFTP